MSSRRQKKEFVLSPDEIHQAQTRVLGSMAEMRLALADGVVDLLIHVASEPDVHPKPRNRNERDAMLVQFDRVSEAIEALVTDQYNGRIALYRAALRNPFLLSRLSKLMSSATSDTPITAAMLEEELALFEANVHIMGTHKAFVF